jgi:hypothetical protein
VAVSQERRENDVSISEVRRGNAAIRLRPIIHPVGATGIYRWFTRRPEPRIGIVMLAVNFVFAITIQALLRAAGP